jgi:hypothetical protein
MRNGRDVNWWDMCASGLYRLCVYNGVEVNVERTKLIRISFQRNAEQNFRYCKRR